MSQCYYTCVSSEATTFTLLPLLAWLTFSVLLARNVTAELLPNWMCGAAYDIFLRMALDGGSSGVYWEPQLAITCPCLGHDESGHWSSRNTNSYTDMEESCHRWTPHARSPPASTASAWCSKYWSSRHVLPLFHLHPWAELVGVLAAGSSGRADPADLQCRRVSLHPPLFLLRFITFLKAHLAVCLPTASLWGQARQVQPRRTGLQARISDSVTNALFLE